MYVRVCVCVCVRVRVCQPHIAQGPDTKQCIRKLVAFFMLTWCEFFASLENAVICSCWRANWNASSCFVMIFHTEVQIVSDIKASIKVWTWVWSCVYVCVCLCDCVCVFCVCYWLFQYQMSYLWKWAIFQFCSVQNIMYISIFIVFNSLLKYGCFFFGTERGPRTISWGPF